MATDCTKPDRERRAAGFCITPHPPTPSSRRRPGPIAVQIRVSPAESRHVEEWVPAFAGMTELGVRIASVEIRESDTGLAGMTGPIISHGQGELLASRAATERHPSFERPRLQALCDCCRGW